MIDHNLRRCYSSENLKVLLMTGPFLACSTGILIGDQEAFLACVWGVKYGFWFDGSLLYDVFCYDCGYIASVDADNITDML